MAFKKSDPMTNNNFDVIIIGGSYSGLSAAMALGRALRTVLVIDGGEPCNRQTPYSHNFLTQDGQTPKHISNLGKEQVLKYSTVKFHEGFAVNGMKTKNGFEIRNQSGEKFVGKKLIFATGIKDIMPDIEGFSECWGISVIHCPYCHGYEVKHEKTGIMANGDIGFHYAQLISNWTKDLIIFTNGKPTFTTEQIEKITANHIPIIEKEIKGINHENGQIKQLIFKNGDAFELKAIYARPAFVQHSEIPLTLGCELNEQGLIKVDTMQKTNVPGVYASGDNSTPMRSVAFAVSLGNMAGAAVNKELIDELF
jgi:thioredoxin reductase